MKRQNLSDGTWFDVDTAECWEEDTWFDGNNHISSATGSQWDHQELYRTKNGKWVLRSWSQWQGSKESWKQISDKQAQKWLVTNSHYDAISVEKQEI